MKESLSVHAQRKNEHLDLALAGQFSKNNIDTRFYYEPMLGTLSPSAQNLECTFLDKKMKAPIWISSMTGGSGHGERINSSLGAVVQKLKLGMGLGSCRSVLENFSNTKMHQENGFILRPIVGKSVPLVANLGIAQLENKQLHHQIDEMVDYLECDGLMIHINPMQELNQKNGSRWSRSGIDILDDFLANTKKKILVKEVGHGFGPQSLKLLMERNLAAIELAGMGGTNFTKIEILRNSSSPTNNSYLDPFISIGHSNEHMLHFLKNIQKSLETTIIFSGGIENYLDGHYLTSRYAGKSMFAFAQKALAYAQISEMALEEFLSAQIQGLLYAREFLVPYE